MLEVIVHFGLIPESDRGICPPLLASGISVAASAAASKRKGKRKSTVHSGSTDNSVVPATSAVAAVEGALDGNSDGSDDGSESDGGGGDSPVRPMEGSSKRRPLSNGAFEAAALHIEKNIQCFTDSFELLKQGRTVVLKRELRCLALPVTPPPSSPRRYMKGARMGRAAAAATDGGGGAGGAGGVGGRQQALGGRPPQQLKDCLTAIDSYSYSLE